MGHLVRVYSLKNKLEMLKKTIGSKSQGMYQLQEHSHDSTGGSTADFCTQCSSYIWNICHEFIITHFFNGVEVDMEVNSGAEHSTNPWAIF